MPTFGDNIRYFVRHWVLPRRATIAHLVKAVLGCLFVALALEVFVFNFNYFASAGYKTVNLEGRIDLSQDSNDCFRLTESSHELEFNNLDIDVHNVAILFDRSQPAQNLDVKIQFTDEAHLRYFDSTEYTEGVPTVQISTASLQSQFVNLNTAGRVGSLKIAIVGDEVSYPIKLETVELNARRPFDFSWLRFVGALGVLLLVYAFRPSSSVYRISLVGDPRKAKAGIVATVALECALLTGFLLFGSNLVGIATSAYNQGEWDGTSIVNTFEVGGDNAQQYAELARSMAEGHLYLDEEPPGWLKEMSTPYDKGARDELQKETGEDYLFDVAYYDGHYYVYFGVVPVILFYLPFYLLTGANFPTALGVLVALLAFVTGVSALLDRFARYHFKRVSLGLYVLMQVSLVTGCGILYLAKFPTFYSLPLACGLAFSVWGLYFWMCGRSARRRTHLQRCLFFAAGSLCMALVAGCRPQLLMLSLLAFPLFWRPYVKERRILRRKGLVEFACLIGPYIVVAALIMLYNHARFGSFTDFGANYNLTVNDMTKRGWVLGRFAPAFFAYFLQFPNMCGEFPFLQPADFATTYMGQTIKESTFGGIFACYPVLWVLLFAAPIVRLRNNQRETNTITGVIGVLLASGVVIAMVDAQMAGILQRYYADFSFMFYAAVVLLVFIVNENIAGNVPPLPSFYPASATAFDRYYAVRHPLKVARTRLGRRKSALRKRHDAVLYGSGALPRDLLMKTLIALVTVGVVYSALLCFVPETGWYSDVYPWAYQDVLETMRFWT